MEDLKDLLTTKAIEKVESERENTRPDFNELGLDEVKLVKKYHAQGGATKHKRATTQSQKAQLTGKSNSVRRLSGIKQSKSLRKRGAGAQSRINTKRKRAMKKRGNTFKRN